MNRWRITIAGLKLRQQKREQITKMPHFYLLSANGANMAHTANFFLVFVRVIRVLYFDPYSFCNHGQG